LKSHIERLHLLLLWRKGWVFLALAAVSSAVAADFFFYDHPLGWTAGAYLFMLIVLVAIRSWRSRQSRVIPSFLFAAIGLIFALVESPTRFNMACAIAALGSLALAIRSPSPIGMACWVGRWSALAIAPLTRPLQDFWRGAHWMKRHPPSAARPLRTVGLWMIPIGLGSLFACLFAIANPVVEHWLVLACDLFNKLVSQFYLLAEPDRATLWIAAAAITYALLRFSRRRRRRLISGENATAQRPTPSSPLALPETAIVTRCLLVFNLVFAVETVLDLIYLWGGRALPAGLNYKQYAHRGAYPLIATALLAGGFVLVTFRNEANTKDSRAARRLVYAWIAQNVLLVVSAGWRLWLYVDVSMLTRLRLATSIWLLLVAAGLLSLIWRILRRRDNDWLIRFNCAMAAAVLYVCCFVNYDGFIASWNAGHCEVLRHGGDTADLSYFRTLGEESLPALRRLEPQLDTPASRAAAVGLIAELNGRITAEMADWRGWTWRRARLSAEFSPLHLQTASNTPAIPAGSH
jgi:hypothetical protein